jgi:DNA-directed RNA polymerase alpha subunit
MSESSMHRDSKEIVPPNQNFDSLTEKLSVRAKRVLADLNIKDLDALLNLTRDNLIQAWSCGKKTIAEIEDLQSKFTPQCEHDVPQESRIELDLDNAPKEIFDAILGVLSVRGVHILHDIDVGC